jgi:hypothetical protein
LGIPTPTTLRRASWRPTVVCSAVLLLPEGGIVMNDLSVFDGDADRERQICDLRVSGKPVAEVCQMLGVTVADINRALDRAAQAALTPSARVRTIHIEAARMEVLEEAFMAPAKGGDDKAAMVVIRAQERKATLMGLNAPLRTDPVQLAIEAAPQLTSTQKLRDIFNRVQAEDPQRKMNGGPGYGDARDDEDEALMRMRERGDYFNDQP